MSEVIEGVYYHEAHDWLSVDGDTGTTGITDYAQSELGDIVFLELPDVGTQVVLGEPYGTVEAVKTVADLISPVSGKVVEVNDQLQEDASLVNTDPYGEGWTIRIRLSDTSELSELMSAEAYRESLE
ncbi:MAG: glycine cleavage system protein H [Gemmatimonadetes bacterium]|jgi:glycine cleavage system H protein|nr:glycine cleavage system protein H [Gemmatimonadota bacterium]